MNPDPGSLENLRDVIEPAPIGWWPPAPGWWVLIAGVLLGVLVLAVRAFLRWRANVYRRSALRELQQASDVAAVAEILKRTAVCAAGRPQVASLTGSAWIAWLQETSTLRVPDPVIRCLTDGVFADRDVENLVSLKEFAHRWIRMHMLENLKTRSNLAQPPRGPERLMRLILGKGG